MGAGEHPDLLPGRGVLGHLTVVDPGTAVRLDPDHHVTGLVLIAEVVGLLHG